MVNIVQELQDLYDSRMPLRVWTGMRGLGRIWIVGILVEGLIRVGNRMSVNRGCLLGRGFDRGHRSVMGRK